MTRVNIKAHYILAAALACNTAALGTLKLKVHLNERNSVETAKVRESFHNELMSIKNGLLENGRTEFKKWPLCPKSLYEFRR